MRYYVTAVLAGTLLSGAAAGLMAATDPYAALPRLSGRHLLAGYRALGGAPTGSAMQVFAVSAVIYTACFLAAGLLARRRGRAATAPPAPAGTTPEHEQEPRPC